MKVSDHQEKKRTYLKRYTYIKTSLYLYHRKDTALSASMLAESNEGYFDSAEPSSSLSGNDGHAGL